MNIPRVIIAGTQSGVGKTTLTIGLMGALKKTGYRVQGFKVGPDYIDPSYQNVVTGRLSENLDLWLAPKDQIVESFRRAIKGADIAVIEGVMGLFDGATGLDETGSTSQIAKILNCPVLLVIDAHNMVRSSAAIALGFKTFDRKVKIKGIILNNVAGITHANWCRDAIEVTTGLPVVGWLPVNCNVRLPERHLGLIPTPEKQNQNVFEEITQFIQANVNIGKVVTIAKSVKHLPRPKTSIYPKRRLKKDVKIGVAFDESFNFYYPSNLSILESYGGEIIRFSPMHDKKLPEDIDGLYIGGGFPEMFLEELEDNQSMRTAISVAVEKGMPVYAECAGLMYLTKAITDFGGRKYDMVDALEGKTIMTNKTLVTYSLASVQKPNILCSVGLKIRGHEFHNSVIADIPNEAKFAYKMIEGEGIKDKQDGWIKNKVLASYMHISFAQDQTIAKTFLNEARVFAKETDS
jgi:cobyrinic acid a,c-diamide synthase